MPDTRTFYRDLPELGAFPHAVEEQRHTPLPDDWWIIIADVIGSTRAIEAGRYKAVNTVGVACIAAVLNVDREIDLPFVFGGDGATFAVPQALVARVEEALRGAQSMAEEAFGLQLRVGLLRVSFLVKDGYPVNVAKLRLSAPLTQATFSGRGWEEAERRVKSGDAPEVVQLQAGDGPARADFDGFECRWQAVPHFNGHKLSLLVAATSGDPTRDLETYQALSRTIGQIYGDVVDYHPLRPEQLQLSVDPWTLSHELRVRAGRSGIRQRFAYGVRLFLLNLAGIWLFATRRDTRAVRWTRYRQELVDNSDFRKFDGMLRMVIDGSDAQAAELERFLASQHQAGRLAYGMFKSRAALVTCLVRSYNGHHLHFVDGSDGGYAAAAIQLKRQLATIDAARQFTPLI